MKMIARTTVVIGLISFLTTVVTAEVDTTTTTTPNNGLHVVCYPSGWGTTEFPDLSNVDCTTVEQQVTELLGKCAAMAKTPDSTLNSGQPFESIITELETIITNEGEVAVTTDEEVVEPTTRRHRGLRQLKQQKQKHQEHRQLGKPRCYPPEKGDMCYNCPTTGGIPYVCCQFCCKKECGCTCASQPTSRRRVEEVEEDVEEQEQDRQLYGLSYGHGGYSGGNDGSRGGRGNSSYGRGRGRGGGYGTNGGGDDSEESSEESDSNGSPSEEEESTTTTTTKSSNTSGGGRTWSTSTYTGSTLHTHSATTTTEEEKVVVVDETKEEKEEVVVVEEEEEKVTVIVEPTSSTVLSNTKVSIEDSEALYESTIDIIDEICTLEYQTLIQSLLYEEDGITVTTRTDRQCLGSTSNDGICKAFYLFY